MPSTFYFWDIGLFWGFFGSFCNKMKPEQLRGSKFGLCETIPRQKRKNHLKWSKIDQGDQTSTTPFLKNEKNISDQKKTNKFFMLLNGLLCLAPKKCIQASQNFEEN